MVKPQICFSHRYKYAVAVTVCFFLYIWHNPTQNISVICNQYAEIQSFTMYCDQADNRRSPPGRKRIISSVHNPDFNLSTRRKMQTLPFSTQRKQVTSWGEGQRARGRRAARKRWKAPLICSAISETRESVVQEEYWPHKFTLLLLINNNRLLQSMGLLFSCCKWRSEASGQSCGSTLKTKTIQSIPCGSI